MGPYLEAESIGSRLGCIYTEKVNSTKPISTAHTGVVSSFQPVCTNPDGKLSVSLPQAIPGAGAGSGGRGLAGQIERVSASITLVLKASFHCLGF